MSESLIDMEIFGLDELDRQLDAFEPQLRCRCVRQGVAAAAAHIAALAQEKAPVLADAEGSRRIPGELRDDIGVLMEDTDESNPSRVGALITPFYDRSDGKQSPGVWGSFVEYGSIHGDPQPFMRPACDEGAEASIEIFVEKASEAMQQLPESPRVAA